MFVLYVAYNRNQGYDVSLILLFFFFWNKQVSIIVRSRVEMKQMVRFLFVITIFSVFWFGISLLYASFSTVLSSSAQMISIVVPVCADTSKGFEKVL